MLFNSLPFVAFFPAVVGLYFLTPPRRRWALLLAASYYFYMCWKAEYVLLILASTLVDYYAGLQMGRLPVGHPSRRYYVALSLATNLGLLFAFKYANFVGDSLRAVLEGLDVTAEVPVFDVLLPVGISFYTFQTLSYTLDVYRGRTQPERHFGFFALYVAFWPQLVAGPIERPGHLLPQLRSHHRFEPGRLRDGLALMLWGFFKKLVIADRLAVYVDAVYADPTAADAALGGGAVWLATYAFAFQIYCDFSGYSDIAIGAARVLGVELATNFRRPYFATSIRDFWARWHVSLSTWFRDYLYVPLGGNRVARGRWYANLMITFLVSGLWHGAAWTFVVWGALHGAYLVFALATSRPRAAVRGRLPLDAGGALHGLWARLVTFHLVLVGWLLFRAEGFGDALALGRLALTSPFDLAGLPVVAGGFDLAVGAAAVVWLLVHEARLGDRDLVTRFSRWSAWSRRAWYLALTLAILWFGVFTSTEFIYFQF